MERMVSGVMPSSRALLSLTLRTAVARHLRPGVVGGGVRLLAGTRNCQGNRA